MTFKTNSSQPDLLFASINFVDKFIDEQVEEEKSVRDILNLFRHRDGHTVATIDDIVGTDQAE